MRRTLSLTSVLLLGGVLTPGAQTPVSPAAGPQAPALTFRAAVNFVEVDAIVTDASGRFVADLTAQDFVVLEDGKPQKLSICSAVQIPIAPAQPHAPGAKPTLAVATDIVTNTRPVDGRVYLFVLDGYHVSAQQSVLVRRQLRSFIEDHLGADDLAAVIHIGAPSAGQELTSNKALLLASADRFVGQALRSATASIVKDALFKQDLPAEITPAPPEDTDAIERNFMARSSIDTMTRVAEDLEGLTGRRKAMLLFSQGIDAETVEAPSSIRSGSRASNNASALRAAEMEMIAAATRANVNVYAIDPRGLVTGMEDGAALGMLPSVSEGGRPEIMAITSEVSSLAADDLRRSRESLRLFADATGGRAIVDRNDIDNAFAHVVADNSAYYVLGYQSPDPRRTGAFHRVSIKVSRPGLQVRTRNGYYAASDRVDPKTPPLNPVSQLLASPAAVGGLGMRLQAAAVRNEVGVSRAHLSVEFTGADVGFREANGLFANDIEIGFQAVEMTGRTRASGRHILHLKLKPATHETFARDGVRYVTEVDLPPGRYQLRLAAHEDVGGRSGSVFTDIEIPDFSAPPLAMSDLLLTSTAAARTLTGTGASSVAERLPGQTTTARAFARDETLSVFAGVYANDLARVLGVNVQTTIADDHGAVVFSAQETRTSQSLGSSRGHWPYTVDVPLRDLAPGRYVLTLTAAPGAAGAGGDVVRKQIAFEIR